VSTDRRRFLASAAALGSAYSMTSLDVWGEQIVNDNQQEASAQGEISAPEDLMREHGVLNRILLVYEEGVRRLLAKEDVPPDALHKPAELVRKFVEDYHEQLEQKFIFPPFEKHQTLVELVAVLRRQHEAGRRLTDTILRSTTADRFIKPEVQQEVIRTCQAFTRMYRPHEAREDTVLFPTLYKIVPAAEIRELGERFEEEEHRLFGDEGFQKTVEHVAGIEKQLGIYDLAGFTPK
jgi:hemerythrin-like domain-containing protein